MKLSPETAAKIRDIAEPITYKKTIGEYENIPVTFTPVWLLLVITISYGFTTTSQAEQIQTLFIDQTPFLELSFTSLPTITQFIFGMAVVSSLYLSVLLHEFGHAIKAHDHDLKVNEITLWLLGGAAKIDISNVSSRTELEVAASGPLVSLFIGVILGVLTVITSLFGFPEILTLYVIIVAAANTAILLFNLLPVFPFDGGRILRAILKYKHTHVSATRYATRITQASSVLFIAYSIFAMQPFFVLVAVFVAYTAKNELKQAVQHKHHIEHKELVKEIANTTETNTEFVDKSDKGVQTSLPIFLQHNTYMANEISHDTDYIITTEEKQEMYESIAETYNAEIILLSYLPELETK